MWLVARRSSSPLLCWSVLAASAVPAVATGLSSPSMVNWPAGGERNFVCIIIISMYVWLLCVVNSCMVAFVRENCPCTHKCMTALSMTLCSSITWLFCFPVLMSSHTAKLHIAYNQIPAGLRCRWRVSLSGNSDQWILLCGEKRPAHGW